jgi:hypothetical protein
MCDGTYVYVYVFYVGKLNCKGMGTLLKILHLSYSFGQKCSKLGTFTAKGLKIQKRE